MAGLQLRYETGLTGEEYVRTEAWREARLERCPNHPHGGCSVARHGTYGRKTPPGAKVPRWYCRESHTTIGLLADCLSSHLPGTLDDLESVVVAAEGSSSLEAAANDVRRDAVELPGALRWVRRRVRLVHDVLARVIGLIPDRLSGCAATMVAVRARLGSAGALMQLRGLVAAQLRMLPSPLGFQPRGRGVPGRKPVFQHSMGPDPPPGAS